MAGIDRAALPSVAEARAMARLRQEGGGGAAVPPPPPARPSRPVRRQAPTDAATAEAQLRQVVAQLTAARKPPPVRSYRQPRLARPLNAAEAEAQVRLIVQPLAAAIGQLGELPSIVGTLVDDGLSWFQRAAQQVHELVEEASATVRGWRDQVLGERGVHKHDDRLDLD
jgi:hypothetical protein